MVSILGDKDYMAREVDIMSLEERRVIIDMITTINIMLSED